MKTAVLTSRCLVYCIGLGIAVISCVLGCQPARQSVERIKQSDVECKVVVRVEWGSGTGELSYLPDNQSDFSPHKPFRYQMDSTGNIYVADLHNERVLIFTSEGVPLRSFSVPMSENGEFMVDIAVGGDRIAVATTDYIYVFDQSGGSVQVLEWPANVGPYGLCSEDAAGKKVQVDGKGNIYACGVGGSERGGTIVQFDGKGHHRKFFVGDFEHFIVGWDGYIYIEQLSYAGTTDGPSDSRVLKFDFQGNQLGEVTIRGHDLADVGLTYPGLLVAVDANGNMYGNVVTVLRDNELVSQEALIQINAEGKVLRIVDRDKFTRPAADVVDKDGNFYLWHFDQVSSEPPEIWRCSP